MNLKFACLTVNEKEEMMTSPTARGLKSSGSNSSSNYSTTSKTATTEAHRKGNLNQHTAAVAAAEMRPEVKLLFVHVEFTVM